MIIKMSSVFLRETLKAGSGRYKSRMTMQLFPYTSTYCLKISHC